MIYFFNKKKKTTNNYIFFSINHKAKLSQNTPLIIRRSEISHS